MEEKYLSINTFGIISYPIPAGISKDMTEMQTSKYAYMTDSSSSIFEKLTNRIKWITGLETRRSVETNKNDDFEEYEPLFVSYISCLLHSRYRTLIRIFDIRKLFMLQCLYCR